MDRAMQSVLSYMASGPVYLSRPTERPRGYTGRSATWESGFKAARRAGLIRRWRRNTQTGYTMYALSAEGRRSLS